MTTRIAIIGLRQIGSSIGLALAQVKDQVTRIGNDLEPGIARRAEKAGAVDKIAFSIPATVRDADLVILAVPVDELRMTLESIAPDLKPGAVVIDTSPVKNKGMGWALEFFPGNDRYFVSVALSLNPSYLFESGTGIENAHADLFQNSLMLISSQPGIDESALALTTNLAKILGATPLFSDTAELDGLLASTRFVPQIMAAALVNSTIEQPGWLEARKLASQAYAMMTEHALYPEEGKEFGQALLLNSENTVRVIDQYIADLMEIRDAIADQDAETLQKLLIKAKEGRELWIKQRMTADWEQKASHNIPIPTSKDIFGRMFGIRPKKNN